LTPQYSIRYRAVIWNGQCSGKRKATAVKGPGGDGPRSDEKSVDIGTIDFWLNGEDDFWYSPEEHDWEPSDTTVLGKWFE
jgi:hypothetical protein